MDLPTGLMDKYTTWMTESASLHTQALLLCDPTHKTSSTLFFLALATKSLTFSAPASSKSDLPISTPSTIFLKVNAMPPQMMSELTCESTGGRRWSVPAHSTGTV